MSALAGRRALVVGGGSGIGLATARLLARDGAHVTIAGRTLSKLEDAAATIEGGSVGVVACDVLDAADVRHAVEVAAEGGLHIAVTVPGGGPFRPVLGYEDDELDAAVRANIRPQFLVLKHAGAAMLRTGEGGSVVAVSSTVADFPMPFNAGYSIGKAAVDQLVRIAADELGGHGVRVNAVRPGLTATDSTSRMVANDALLARFLEQQPIKRVGQPLDIASAIRWLAGPESSWVTGQIVTVDGGHTLRRFPDLTDVARSTLGEDVFDAVFRGEVPR